MVYFELKSAKMQVEYAWEINAHTLSGDFIESSWVVYVIQLLLIQLAVLMS